MHLKSHAVLVTLTALISLSTVNAAPIGSVSALEGSASAERGGQSIALSLHAEIQLNDRIITAEKSKLQIKFTDDSIMSLGESSDLVMDEYVYDPSKSGDNSFGANLGNGIFRVISGKIVELNPNRFKVKTARSTIGIRGCELGFINNNNGLQVLIFSIPPGHEILIGDVPFRNAGRAVKINNEGQLDDQPLDSETASQFDESTKTKESNGDGEQGNGGGEQQEGEEDVLTEGELVEVLVNTLGLATMLPPSPSQADMIQMLMQNGIVPQDGWHPDRIVTLGNLARILVQTLGQSDMVENPDDDSSWINYLLSLGIDLSTIQSAVREVPSADPNAGYSDVRQATDPLRRNPFALPFEGEGFTVQEFREILSQILPPVPPPPRPVTPN